MQIVKVAANVVPQPATATVQHHAILLAVVIIWLILSPGWFLHNLAWWYTTEKQREKGTRFLKSVNSTRSFTSWQELLAFKAKRFVCIDPDATNN